MFNKWVLLACCLSLWQSIEAGEPEGEVMAIERQIQALKARLDEGRFTEMKEDVESQEFMIADWEVYGRDVQDIHQREEENRRIQKQIEQLEQRKAQLIKQKTTGS